MSLAGGSGPAEPPDAVPNKWRRSGSVSRAVTVVVPTFNRRDLVVQAVRSVLRQLHSELTCLVVDNGSTDGTADALGALRDNRVRVIHHDRPVGAAEARNIGLRYARTPWVAFLDNDDFWAPTKLHAQLEALARYPSSAWCATGCANIDERFKLLPGGRLVREGTATGPQVLLGPDEMAKLLAEDNPLPGGGSSVLVSRDLLVAAGGFHNDVPGCEDWDTWVRLSLLSPLVYVDAPFVAYRVWPGQASRDVEMMLSSAKRVREKYFPGAGPPRRQYTARLWQGAAKRKVALGETVGAARCFATAARVGRAPGQLAYAVAVPIVPGLVSRRLEALEAKVAIGEDWRQMAESWLSPLRSEYGHSGDV